MGPLIAAASGYTITLRQRLPEQAVVHFAVVSAGHVLATMGRA
jgi:hypothetical protein